MADRLRAPWRYPRDAFPNRWRFQLWRRWAHRMARKLGYRTACGLCKRPINQWGELRLVHPRSRGNARERRVCIQCANLVIHMLDVLEWGMALEHVPERLVPEELRVMMPVQEIDAETIWGSGANDYREPLDYDADISEVRRP